MKKFLGEFKKFISRGNVIDMAVGVIVGGAFKAIIDSLVNDILSPLLGVLVSDNFADLSVDLGIGVTLQYGKFVMAIINFLLMAWVLFCIVKFMNNFKQKEEPKLITTKECPYCKSSIPLAATRCPHCTSELKG